MLKQEVIAVRPRERVFVPIVGRPQKAHLSKRRERIGRRVCALGDEAGGAQDGCISQSLRSTHRLYKVRSDGRGRAPAPNHGLPWAFLLTWK